LWLQVLKGGLDVEAWTKVRTTLRTKLDES
jgi:hypothetical protein